MTGGRPQHHVGKLGITSASESDRGSKMSSGFWTGVLGSDRGKDLTGFATPVVGQRIPDPFMCPES